MTSPQPFIFQEWLQCYAGDAARFVSEVLGTDPLPWQREVLAQYDARCRRMSIRSGHGVGKAQPLDTELDTPDGPRRFGDLRVGDMVFGRSGHPTPVLGVFPQGTLPAYRVTLDDGSSTVVSGEHLWTVRGRQGRRTGSGWETCTTNDLLRRGVTRSNGRARAKQWELPRCDPWQYPAQPISVGAYTLGVWLGDGTKRGSEITSADPELPDLLAADNQTGPVTVRQTASAAKTLRVPGLRRQLRHLGLLGTTTDTIRVPALYRRNTVAVRLAVLQGLMDTDGTVGKSNGSAQFTSTSLGLVQDVMWLARSLGGKAHAPTVKRPWFRNDLGERQYGKDAYTVTVRLDAFPLFRLARKQDRLGTSEARYLTRWIARIDPCGDAPMQCIQVAADDGLYLTTDGIVTHNTWLLAWIMLHHQLCRFPQKTVVTAPTADQLWDALWAEYRSWVNRLPFALREMLDLKSDRCELKLAPSESFVSARTSRPEAPDAMQGVHSGDRDGEGFVLLIGDEAAGIPDAVFEAAGGSMSGHHCTMILTGNPTHVGGYFYDTHTKLQDRWWTRRVPRSECPYADPEYDQEIAARYGIHSNVYRVRVLGEFPTADEDTVIPRELVESAIGREIHAAKTTPVIWGVDCARFGDDRSALCKRQGNVVLERIKTWRKRDTMTLAAEIAQEYRVTPGWLRPRQINVDVIGIGSGVHDRLRQLGLPSRGINVAESPALLRADTYLNLRTELWFKAREWFERREAKLPESYRHRMEGDDLVTELSTPAYEFQTRSGRLMVEGKEDVKKRLSGASPDLAEALILTFASDAVTLQHGMTASTSWTQPLSRDLGIV